MKLIAAELKLLVEAYENKFAEIDDLTFSHKPTPEKWSKKEIVGHLIDSAHNNLRRFIVGQYQEHQRIVYEQNFWVNANHYQQAEKVELITLWAALNKRIAVVLNEMPETVYLHVVDTQNLTLGEPTLLWLAADYVAHLKHHINQIFPGSFPVFY